MMGWIILWSLAGVGALAVLFMFFIFVRVVRSDAEREEMRVRENAMAIKEVHR
jgi:hypothetical protein